MKKFERLLLTAVCVVPHMEGSADRQNKDNKVVVVWHVLKEYSVEWHKLKIGSRFTGSCDRSLSVSRLRC
jgi:hypothetical protein